MSASEDAVVMWQNAIRQRPGELTPYLNLARVYKESGRRKEALATYLDALSRSASPRAYLAVGPRLPGLVTPYLLQWVNAHWQLRRATQVGAWARATGRPVVTNQGSLVVGDRVQIRSHYMRSIFTTFPGGRLEIGDRSIINYGADIVATKLVSIGADCLIGTRVLILDNDFHGLTDRSVRPEGKPVIIEDGVWIANGAIILPGVTIRQGAAVGAGCVVMTDVPARSLVLGNPARVVKKF